MNLKIHGIFCSERANLESNSKDEINGYSSLSI